MSFFLPSFLSFCYAFVGWANTLCVCVCAIQKDSSQETIISLMGMLVSHPNQINPQPI